MVSYQRAGELLDQIAESLPQEVFKKLTGGIIFLEEEKMSPKAINQDLFLLGQYNVNNMGRYIQLFYGSFVAVFGHLSETRFAEELKKTLVHELTHHLESLAGEHGLEDEDDVYLSKYLNRHKPLK